MRQMNQDIQTLAIFKKAFHSSGILLRFFSRRPSGFMCVSVLVRIAESVSWWLVYSDAEILAYLGFYLRMLIYFFFVSFN